MHVLRSRAIGTAYGFTLAAAISLTATPAAALPIGFGINQGDLVYEQMTSDHFKVYLDQRVPAEGALTLNALESARPFLERWFDQHRKTPLRVIMSAQTTNASFADFITDALEIQTQGQGNKELAWHEYTHSTMFRAYDNIFGPAGSILHLPWIPSWFLEGLAESTSVSTGSDITAGIERYQALSGDWPTYDRLHSLYTSANFFERGYATSGAMVSYLLRRGDPNKFPQMLRDTYNYSLPWWWPLTPVPYAGFMPFDRALQNYLGLDGERFYEEYKKAAAEHWQKAYAAPFLVADKAAKQGYLSLFGLRSDGRQISLMTRIDYDLHEMAVTFDGKTGWGTAWKDSGLVTDPHPVLTAAQLQNWRAVVRYIPDPPQDISTLTFTQLQPASGKEPRELTVKRKGAVYSPVETPTHFGWYEQQQGTTRWCEMAKDTLKIACPVVYQQPQQLRFLGERGRKAGERLASEVWLAVGTQKLSGTSYETLVYDTRKHAVTHRFSTGAVQPISAAFAGTGGANSWLLVGERDRRTLRRMSADGRCLGQLTYRDHLLDVRGLDNGDLVLAVYGGMNSYLLQLPAAKRKEEACKAAGGQISPLQYALTTDPKMDFRTALTGASLWAQEGSPNAAATARLAADPTADKAVQPGTGSDTTPLPVAYKTRPLFIFPWVGADDYTGVQLGIVSVPLMDNLQNETVRATFFYGPYSHFPYSELALTSTRFRPTLNLALFRQQTYNGVLKQNGLYYNDYYDEKGARLESLTTFRLLGGVATAGAAVKYSYLKPYVGPKDVRHGWLVQPGASLSLVNTYGRYTWTNAIAGRIAPALLNKQFDYNQVGGSSTLGVDLPAFSKLTLGLELSRTRGKKTLALEELYVPLRTFIPGTGGGFNQTSYALGNGSSSTLFGQRQGDTEARSKIDWTIPVIRQLDKNWWLLYFERLDFSTFYNYGAAWNGIKPKQHQWSQLIPAEGFSLDLQMENHGLHFNTGLGIGRVLGEAWLPYLSLGFDALF